MARHIGEARTARGHRLRRDHKRKSMGSAATPKYRPHEATPRDKRHEIVGNGATTIRVYRRMSSWFPRRKDSGSRSLRRSGSCRHLRVVSIATCERAHLALRLLRDCRDQIVFIQPIVVRLAGANRSRRKKELARISKVAASRKTSRHQHTHHRLFAAKAAAQIVTQIYWRGSE